MTRVSAGLLLFRRSPGLEVFLVHPGGPFFARKDAGAWSIPKGWVEGDEEPLETARREFIEETGCSTAPPYLSLGEVRLKSGKRVLAWAAEGDLDPAALVSNTFELEWPPRSGRTRSFPEVDRGAWFEPGAARERLNPAQWPLVERLIDALGGTSGPLA